MPPIFDAALDALVLAAAVLALTLAFGSLLRRHRPAWSTVFVRYRRQFVFVLAAVLVAAKVAEDVIGGDSGGIDRGLLLWLHGMLPPSLGPLLVAITNSGSMPVLAPITAAGTALLLVARRWLEAAVLTGSLVAAALLIWALKAAVGRARPALWETDWYWGASFPSGHTLGTTALAVALVVVVGRVRPRWRGPALALAVPWVLAVAFSRLALGVHWPTDVLAAAALGSMLPLLVAAGLHGLRWRWRHRQRPA